METLRRDGVRLSFRRVDGAGPPVVLIHGWCCDHSHLAPQFEHFARLGHKVIAVDLRGHGESDKPVQRYPISGFADDVVWLADRLALERPILVGHSMGGIVAFDIASRFPDLPAAIVMIDAAIVVPTASRPGMIAMIERLATPSYAAVQRDFVSHGLFLSSDDPERKARILDMMGAAPQHMMVAAMEGLRDYDPGIASGRVVAPSLYIAADEPSPRTDVARLSDLLPGMMFGQTVGSGHFCQLEVPDQVNAMIDRFLAITHARS